MSAQADPVRAARLDEYHRRKAISDAEEITEADRVRALYPHILAELQRLDPSAGWLDVVPTEREPIGNGYTERRAIGHSFRAEDGRQIDARRGWPETDRNGITRICWTGSYPRTAKGEYLCYDRDDAPTVNTSSARQPEQIAADVVRRLLPPYAELRAEVAERVAAHDRSDDDRQETIARIISETLAEPYGQQQDRNPRAHISLRADSWAEIQPAAHGRADIQLRGIPADVAVRLLNIAYPPAHGRADIQLRGIPADVAVRLLNIAYPRR